jgi:hypothetical protein
MTRAHTSRITRFDLRSRRRRSFFVLGASRFEIAVDTTCDKRFETPVSRDGQLCRSWQQSKGTIAKAEEAAKKADQARLAALTASREVAQATMPLRRMRNLKLREEERLADAERSIASADSIEAKEAAETAKANSAAKIAELEAQLVPAEAELQPKPSYNRRSIMQVNKLTLERHTGRRPGRRHDGVVTALRSNIRWCSDHFELVCRNGEIVRVLFCYRCLRSRGHGLAGHVRRHLRRDGARPDSRLRRASIRDQQGGASRRMVVSTARLTSRRSTPQTANRRRMERTQPLSALRRNERRGTT